MKIVCIYHSIDLDGWMSAAGVLKWYKDNHHTHLINNINIVKKIQRSNSRLIYLANFKSF